MTTASSHYLLIGLGKIGLEVANRLAIQGNSVTAVSRSYKADMSETITQIQADARDVTSEELGADSSQQSSITHICIIVSPDSTSEQGYRDSYLAICDNIAKLSKSMPNLQRLVYISSTGVYGQNNGDIIDISTPIAPPTSPTSKILLATEQLLQQQVGEKCTIIRASGIYGKDRLRVVKMAENLAKNEDEGAQHVINDTWTNRIFATDLINVIVNVLTEAQPLPVYLATDFEPVPLFRVLSEIAKIKQLSLPAKLSTSGSLPVTGKRIISNLPKNWLNYPNYQIGYQAILEK